MRALFDRIKLTPLTALAVFLLASCMTASPYGAFSWGGSDQIELVKTFRDRIEKDFDRLVLLKLEIETKDPSTRLLLSKWLILNGWDSRVPATSIRKEGEWMGIYDFGNSRLRYEDGKLIAFIALQANTDSITVKKLSFFDFELDSRGQSTNRREMDFPVGWAFSLKPDSINYLGRLRLVILGKEEVGAGERWVNSNIVRTTTASIRYRLEYECDPDFAKADLEEFFALQPEMNLNDKLKNSVSVSIGEAAH